MAMPLEDTAPCLINVKVSWDADARVWWTEESELEGLIAEAPTLDGRKGLVSQIRKLVPILAEYNGFPIEDSDGQYPLCVLAKLSIEVPLENDTINVRVDASWDQAAGEWAIEECDIPEVHSLRLKANTIDELEKLLKMTLPGLLLADA